MSYIRASSNPEGLYIIGTRWKGRDYVQILLPNGGDIVNIPHDTFHTACKKWIKDDSDHEYIVHKNVEIRYCWDIDYVCKGDEKIPTTVSHYKVEFLYKNKSIFRCWETTWEYILNDVMKREKLYKRAKKS